MARSEFQAPKPSLTIHDGQLVTLQDSIPTR
jgi:hypothetical protein